MAIACIFMGIIINHDEGILSGNGIQDIAEDNIKIEFYLITNNTMSHTEKYDLAVSLCESTYDNEVRNMWIPPNREKWVKTNVLELIN